MRPGGGISWSFVSEQRIRQLERKLRAKEERIIVLETENALLHLKLAEWQGTMGKISVKESHNTTVYYKQQNLKENIRSILSQLYGTIQRLKQEMNRLRLSALSFSRDVQHQSESYLCQILAVVQRLQLHNEVMQTFQTKALELEQSLHEVNERYQQEKQKRKVLHNSLVELRGNIRVHCRVRPLLPFDTASGESVSKGRRHRNSSEKVVCAVDDETILVKCSRPGHTSINKKYQFERVYSAAESQEAVFAEVSPLLTSLLDGYNVCIMAYGQTGSGKTYTMLGPQPENNFGFPMEDKPQLGIIPRAAEEIFSVRICGLLPKCLGTLDVEDLLFAFDFQEKPPGSHWFEISVVEVYNNEVFDLLAKDHSGRTSGVKRDIVTNKEGKSDIPLLTYEPIEDAAEFVKLVKKSLQLRVKHPTLVHAHSSRSHLVVSLTITMKTGSEDDFASLCAGDSPSQRLDKECFTISPHSVKDDRSSFSSRASSPTQFFSEATAEKFKQIRTKLQLVDLAGSECAGMSGVTGAVLRETSFINRSLAALADVLGAISEQRSHIPYRNSKLTHLLQDSIGGDAKLLLMLCVSPSQKYTTESLQTLGFGTRARQVQRGQARKQHQPVLSKPK